MPTLPPRSVSYPDHSDRCYRALCLPNGTCTYLPPDCPRLGSEFDPFQYEGWDPASWKLEAEVTDLTDDEIREICQARAAEREGVIARIAASRKAQIPAQPTYVLSGPKPRTLYSAEAEYLICFPDGKCWYLGESEHLPGEDEPWSARHGDMDGWGVLASDLTDDEIRSLDDPKDRQERVAAIVAARAESWAPAYSPKFAESLRAQGLGAREPVWEEPEDLVAEPPHYRLPGGREALEDVIAPICDALSERRLPGSAVYMIGNALKYLSRLGAKGSPLEDLRKAREYLDRAISRMDAGV